MKYRCQLTLTVSSKQETKTFTKLVELPFIPKGKEAIIVEHPPLEQMDVNDLCSAFDQEPLSSIFTVVFFGGYSLQLEAFIVWADFDVDDWGDVKELMEDTPKMLLRNGFVQVRSNPVRMDKPLSDMDFSVRVRKCFRRLNITMASELCKFHCDDLLVLKDFGDVCLREVRSKLSKIGLKLRGEKESGIIEM